MRIIGHYVLPSKPFRFERLNDMRNFNFPSNLYGAPAPNSIPAEERRKAQERERAANPYYNDYAIYVEHSLYNTSAYQAAVNASDEKEAKRLIADASVTEVLNDVKAASPTSTLAKEFQNLIEKNHRRSVINFDEPRALEELQRLATETIGGGTFFYNMRLLVIPRDAYTESGLRIIFDAIANGKGTSPTYPLTYQGAKSALILKPLDNMERSFKLWDDENFEDDYEEGSFIKRNALPLALGSLLVIAVGVHVWRSNK